MTGFGYQGMVQLPRRIVPWFYFKAGCQSGVIHLWSCHKGYVKLRRAYVFAAFEFLTPVEREVLILLHCYRNHKTGVAWPSEHRLAEDLRYSESTIRRGLHGLRDKGFITILRGRPNRYEITDLEESLTP